MIGADGVRSVARPALYGDDSRQSAAFAVKFLCLRDAAQFQNGLAPRLLQGHAGAQVVVNVQLQMTLQFVAQFVVTRLLVKESAETPKPSAHAPHCEGLLSPMGSQYKRRSPRHLVSSAVPHSLREHDCPLKFVRVEWRLDSLRRSH